MKLVSKVLIFAVLAMAIAIVVSLVFSGTATSPGNEGAEAVGASYLQNLL